MKTKLLLLVVLISSIIFSQNSSIEYYPLEIGTYHYYERTSCVLPENDCNTRIIGRSVVKDTLMDNDKVYFKVAERNYSNNELEFSYQRLDSSNAVVYKYFDNLDSEDKERPILFLAAQTNDTNSVYDSDTGTLQLFSTVLKTYSNSLFGTSLGVKDHENRSNTFYELVSATRSIGITSREENADFYSMQDTLVAFHRSGIWYGDYAAVDTISNSQFYPLSVGNKWNFESKYYSVSPDPEVSYFTKEVRGDTTMPNGVNYFIVKNRYTTSYERFDPVTNFIHYFETRNSIVQCEENDTPVYSLNYEYDETIKWTYCDLVYHFATYDDSDLYNDKPTIIINLDYLVVEELTFQKGLGNRSISIIEGSWYFATVLDAIINGDSLVITSIVNESPEQSVNSFLLSQNYPNPFNPSTTITFSVPVVDALSEVEGRNVSLIICDVLGRRVAKLIDEPLPAGTHEIEFDASNLSSGIYYYQLTSGNYQSTRKMILLK